MKSSFLTPILLGGILILLLAGCARNHQMSGGTYNRISQQEAKTMMAREDGHLILDVRSREEYEAGHIPGAILLPNETIGQEPPPELPDKDQILLIYCRSGNRSRQAAQKLADLGYTRVYEFGGVNTWDGEITTQAAPVPETDPTEESGPATLVFQTFDGGGPSYTPLAEDPELISWEQVRDYGSGDPGLVEGAACQVVFTFTGHKPGTTTLTIQERSPIAGNADWIYRVTVGEDLSVTLEQLQVRDP